MAAKKSADFYDSVQLLNKLKKEHHLSAQSFSFEKE